MLRKIDLIALAVIGLFLVLTFGRAAIIGDQTTHAPPSLLSSGAYAPDCTSRNDADLCAQKRLSDLAERQARSSERTNSLLGASILLGGAALAAFVWAARTHHTTSQRQLRAYVTMRSVSVADLYGSPVFKVALQNGGLTPAYKVRCRASIAIVRHPFDGPFDHARDDGDPPAFTMLAGATTTVPVALADLWKSASTADLKSGKLAIFIFGDVRYRDVFDVEHVTAFRTMMGGDSGIIQDGALAFCSNGNDST